VLKKLASLMSFLLSFWFSYELPTLLKYEQALTAHISQELFTRNTGNSLYYKAVSKSLSLKVSLSKHQVTLYQGTNKIKSYPVAIGRSGWETPKGNFKVIELWENPTWIHPLTGQVISSKDPRNPLGHYWIGFWTNGRNWIGFHGTPDTNSVGKDSSHGCIRMYNKDVEELAHQVSIGTVVTVVK